MAKNDIGVRVGVDGEKQFQQQIRDINKSLGVLDDQLKLTSSEFSSESSEQEKATQKARILTAQIKEQEKALQLEQEQLERVKKAKGEDSDETRRQEEIVRKTAQQLDIMNNELAETERNAKNMGESMKTAGDKIEKVGSKIKSIGNTMTKYVTTPILAAGVASFKMASDLQENMNKTEVAFGDSADEVVKWSETTIDKFGLAQSTALEMASQFGDMATSMGFTTDEASGMSQTLVGLAADLASFKNIGTDQAMTALNAIFTGETESLKRLGVVMTEANVQAYAMSKGIKKSYKEMSQAEKVSLRYQYVLDMTKNAQGDFERTSDGAANQMRMMRERVKELGAQFGEKLLPVGEKILKFVNDLLDRFSSLDDGTQQTIIQVGLFAAALGPVVRTVGSVTEGIGGMVHRIGELTGKLSEAEGASGLFGSKMSGVTSGIGAVGQGALIAAPFVIAFGAAMDSIGDAIWNADKPIHELAEGLENSLPNIQEYESYISSATSALNGFALESTSAGQHLGEYDEGIQSSIENIHTITATAAEESRKLTEAEWAEIQNLIGAIEEYTNKKIEAYEQQQAVVSSMAEMEVNMTKERSAELVKAAEDTKNQTIAIANQKYQQMLTEAETMYAAGEIEKKAYDDMRQQATDDYNNAVSTANKKYSETNAIISQKFFEQNVLTNKNAKAWEDYYRVMGNSQADYEELVNTYLQQEREGRISHEQAMALIKDGEEKIAEGRLQIQQEWMEKAGDNWDESTQDTISYWLTMASNTELYGGKVTSKEQQFVKNFVRIIDDLPDDMKQTAKEAMDGFGKEMTDRQPSLFQKASNIAGGIINTLNKVFQIHSPSRVMRQIAGYVWKGFELETDKQSSIMDEQAREVAEGINRNFSTAFSTARASQVSIAQERAASGTASVDPVGAMKQALSGVKIVLDDEVAGRFVEKTVTDIVYS